MSQVPAYNGREPWRSCPVDIPTLGGQKTPTTTQVFHGKTVPMKNRVSLSSRQSSSRNFFRTLAAAASSDPRRSTSLRKSTPSSQSSIIAVCGLALSSHSKT